LVGAHGAVELAMGNGDLVELEKSVEYAALLANDDVCRRGHEEAPGKMPANQSCASEGDNALNCSIAPSQLKWPLKWPPAASAAAPSGQEVALARPGGAELGFNEAAETETWRLKRDALRRETSLGNAQAQQSAPAASGRSAPEAMRKDIRYLWL